MRWKAVRQIENKQQNGRISPFLPVIMWSVNGLTLQSKDRNYQNRF